MKRNENKEDDYFEKMLGFFAGCTDDPLTSNSRLETNKICVYDLHQFCYSPSHHPSLAFLLRPSSLTHIHTHTHTHTSLLWLRRHSISTSNTTSFHEHACYPSILTSKDPARSPLLPHSIHHPSPTTSSRPFSSLLTVKSSAGL